MKFDTRKIKEILNEGGKREVFEFSDANGFAFVTDWGIPLPEITLKCVNMVSGKVIQYVHDLPLLKFLEDSIIAGKHYTELDDFFFKMLDVKINTRAVIQKDPERAQRIKEFILKYHKDKVVEMDDFKLKQFEVTPSEVKLAEARFNARVKILSRLDKEFKSTNTEESQLATFVIPKKDGTFVEFRGADTN